MQVPIQRHFNEENTDSNSCNAKCNKPNIAIKQKKN